MITTVQSREHDDTLTDINDKVEDVQDEEDAEWSHQSPNVLDKKHTDTKYIVPNNVESVEHTTQR